MAHYTDVKRRLNHRRFNCLPQSLNGQTDIIKAPNYCSFVSGIHQSLMD